MRFLEQGLDIPLLLFSWTDPAMTPQTVKIVFNDSIWAMAPRALKSMPPPGGEILIPSLAQVLKDRIEEKGDFRRLRAIVQGKF